MMLEAGSNPRVRNKARLTPLQLVDPSNKDLRDLIQQHEYASQNAGDFVNVDARPSGNKPDTAASPISAAHASADDSDDDAEFSGSDDEERAEWERRRKERGQRS